MHLRNPSSALVLGRSVVVLLQLIKNLRQTLLKCFSLGFAAWLSQEWLNTKVNYSQCLSW